LLFSLCAGRFPVCLKHTAFCRRLQGALSLFRYIFVASSRITLLIDRDFSHFSHGENAPFVQNIEIAQLRNEVCRCAANDVLCNDVPAAPEMMQPPQAAIVP